MHVSDWRPKTCDSPAGQHSSSSVVVVVVVGVGGVGGVVVVVEDAAAAAVAGILLRELLPHGRVVHFVHTRVFFGI